MSPLSSWIAISSAIALGGDGNDFAGIGVAGTGFHDALHRKWPQNGTDVDSSG